MAGKPFQLEEPLKVSAKVFQCHACGSNVTLLAQGLSVTVTCRSCGSLIDATNENYQILAKGAYALKLEPLIPLGKRGKLHGEKWEVLGVMIRVDETGVYSWREYLLFNPMKGFRWLMEFDGHWSYIVQTKEKPKVTNNTEKSKSVRCLGKTYARFHKGTARVTYVFGEFYWRVQVGETVVVEDYIAPPEILSCEKSDGETVWSIGEYISADAVRIGFEIDKPMPLQLGVAPNQPSSVSSMTPAVKRYWVVFVALLMAMQFYHIVSSPHELVYEGTFNYSSVDPNPGKLSPSFELKNGTDNLKIVLSSAVKNEWLSIDADLMNEETDQSFDWEQGVEYYSGYEPEDGYWQEGSTESTELLSSVPAGRYHLYIQASGTPHALPAPVAPPPTLPPADSANTPGSTGQLASTQLTSTQLASGQPPAPPVDPGQNYSIRIYRGVTTWSNFLWAFFLLSIIPMIVWWRSRSFERSRWSTSDFSPHWHIDKEDWI